MPAEHIRKRVASRFAAACLAAALFVCMITCCQAAGIGDRLDEDDARRIADIVFRNECGSDDANLISWNEGEGFISLGIGHFIWFPEGGEEIFVESFPEFIKFARSERAGIPEWLDAEPVPHCPWKSREEYLAAAADRRLIGLREFLMSTKPVQAKFIVRRLDEALPAILEAAPPDRREYIARQFERVASTAEGVYALADYVNFKGLGTSPAESYNGKGWGLLQVLDGMKDEAEAPDALREFSASAAAVLEERVNNSPPERNERRWLPGWRNRAKVDWLSSRK